MQWKWLFISVCIFESFSFTAEWAAEFKPFTHNMGHYMLQGVKQLLPNCFPTVSNNTGKKYSSSSKWSVWLLSPPWQMKHLLWSRQHQHTVLVLKLLKFLKSSFTKDGQWAKLLLSSFFCLQNARSAILGRHSLELFPELWNAKQGQIYFWSELAYFSLWLSDYTLQSCSASMSGAHLFYFIFFLSLL